MCGCIVLGLERWGGDVVVLVRWANEGSAGHCLCIGRVDSGAITTILIILE